MIDLLFDPSAWAALLTLTVLEIVLGIDNLIFISVLTARLDPERARRARAVGLSLAFIFRVIMLAGLTWLMGLTAPIVTVFGTGISLARRRWRCDGNSRGRHRGPVEQELQHEFAQRLGWDGGNEGMQR
jgi:predicted tellurium resistance membrane protein TerC